MQISGIGLQLKKIDISLSELQLDFKLNSFKNFKNGFNERK